jgi:hypothetical protein
MKLITVGNVSTGDAVKSVQDSPQVVHPKQKMLLMSYQQAACQAVI